MGGIVLLADERVQPDARKFPQFAGIPLWRSSRAPAPVRSVTFAR
jgi:hypothetical protein